MTPTRQRISLCFWLLCKARWAVSKGPQVVWGGVFGEKKVLIQLTTGKDVGDLFAATVLYHLCWEKPLLTEIPPQQSAWETESEWTEQSNADGRGKGMLQPSCIPVLLPAHHGQPFPVHGCTAKPVFFCTPLKPQSTEFDCMRNVGKGVFGCPLPCVYSTR